MKSMHLSPFLEESLNGLRPKISNFSKMTANPTYIPDKIQHSVLGSFTEDYSTILL